MKNKTVFDGNKTNELQAKLAWTTTKLVSESIRNTQAPNLGNGTDGACIT